MGKKLNKNETPTLAIVGRPNVGKSSLFNAIIGRRLAIVHEESGVTRDRIVAPAIWKGKHFQVVDTGGLGVFTDEKKRVGKWDIEIRDQVEAAITDADIIVFVTDIQEGATALDEEIAVKLRECGKKVVLAPNKTDNPKLEEMVDDFSILGFESPCPISTLHRRGIGLLLEQALEDVKSYGELDEAPPFPIAVVGRPNVGKSSLVNRLLGEKRVMVSDIAGTTRDSVDVEFEIKYKDEMLPAVLIDTAGLRKRSKVDTPVEVFSVMRAESAIKRARLVLFVVEARPDGLTAQDKHIARIIADHGKGSVIVANKWDECKGHKQKHVLDEIRRTLPGMSYAPVVFTCAITGYNFGIMLDYAAEVMSQMEVHVPTSTLNKAMTDAFEYNAPPAAGKSRLKLYYSTMIGNGPPRFALFVNNPKFCPANYFNYLVNYLRRCFDFTGLPIELQLRARPKREFVPSPKPAKKKAPAKSKKQISGKKDRKQTKKRETAKKKNTAKRK